MLNAASVTLLWLVMLAVRRRRRGAEQDLLEPDQAFRFSARVLGARRGRSAATRSRPAITCTATSSSSRSSPRRSSSARPSCRRASVKKDEFFGEVETYRGEVRIRAAGAETRAAASRDARRDFAGLRRRRRVLRAARADREAQLAAAGAPAIAACRRPAPSRDDARRALPAGSADWPTSADDTVIARLFQGELRGAGPELLRRSACCSRSPRACCR